MTYIFFLIFQFDLDRDGYIDLKELKNLIKSQQCQQLPKGLARQIMKQADTVSIIKLSNF